MQHKIEIFMFLIERLYFLIFLFDAQLILTIAILIRVFILLILNYLIFVCRFNTLQLSLRLIYRSCPFRFDFHWQSRCRFYTFKLIFILWIHPWFSTASLFGASDWTWISLTFSFDTWYSSIVGCILFWTNFVPLILLFLIGSLFAITLVAIHNFLIYFSY